VELKKYELAMGGLVEEALNVAVQEIETFLDHSINSEAPDTSLGTLYGPRGYL
jgi:hypothetical protein